MRTEKNLLDILADPDDKEDISLTDENGKEFIFKQIAVIPYEGKVYCVLQPVSEIKGIEDDEAIVFRVDFDADGTPMLKLEESEETAEKIFREYYDMLS